MSIHVNDIRVTIEGRRRSIEAAVQWDREEFAMTLSPLAWSLRSTTPRTTFQDQNGIITLAHYDAPTIMHGKCSPRVLTHIMKHPDELPRRFLAMVQRPTGHTIKIKLEQFQKDLSLFNLAYDDVFTTATPFSGPSIVLHTKWPRPKEFPYFPYWECARYKFPVSSIIPYKIALSADRHWNREHKKEPSSHDKVRFLDHWQALITTYGLWDPSRF